MAIQVNQPYDQFFETDGSPLDNGYIYIGTTGLNPVTNPISVYWDVGLTIPATQPLRTMNGYIVRNGTPARPFVSPDDYSMLLKSSDGTTIWSTLSASTILINLDADAINYYAPDSAETMTIQDRLQLLDGETITAGNADGPEKASVNCFRDTTSVAGGAGGFVNYCMYAQTDAGSAQTSFEWTILGLMNNYNDSSAENVAGYFHGNKYGTGSTWGAVCGAFDRTGVADPTGGLVALELNVFANGTDANYRRIGMDLVIGKVDTSGTLPTIYAGIRIVPQSFDYTKGKFKHGILVDAICETALRIVNPTGGTWGINITGDMGVGIDLSGGSYSGDAIRIPADAGPGPSHTGIGFDSSGNHKLFYSSHATGLGLFYANAGVTLMSILDTGKANFFGSIQINDLQVVNDRITGYSAMTGTANKATVYDTSSITLVQLATRVKSIQDSLTSHGLIGT